MVMRPPVIAALVAGLSACAVVVPVDPPQPPAAAGGDACGASGLRGLIGQPRAVLTQMKFGGPVRIVGPGDAVTMDYNAERLNIEIGADGRIARIGCY